MSARTRFVRKIGYWFLWALVYTVRWLPLPVVLLIGRRLGDLVRLVSGKRYRVALKNLRIAYCDTLDERERRRIARESFRHFGMFAMESIKFAFVSDAEVERRFDSHEMEEYVARHRDELARGCLAITGHLGNFELPSIWLHTHGFETIVLTRAARDPQTTRLMNQLRERKGITPIDIRGSLKAIMTGLRRGAVVGIVCDQNATDVFVPFFGRPTGTVDGPARIALRAGVPLVFYSCCRDGRGRYALRLYGSYTPVPTGDNPGDVLRVMTEVNRQLETMIRANPEQWLWFHDRWKSSPGVGAAPE